METREFNGKTVEEALKIALKEFDVTEDKVEYTITDEGSKGLFSFIGARPARIRVTLKKKPVEDGINFLKELLKKMGIEAEVLLEEKKNQAYYNISGENIGNAIGYRGETLDAIQYLLSAYVNKDRSNGYKKVVLDAGAYRQKREETIKKLALKTAYKAKKYNRTIKFEPMNPYERKIIHTVLQDDKQVVTYSEGTEPYRRVIVSLK
ncbi:MAG: RNA-binding cell elongation regulator Jag/EloR [Sarcina sp.]